MLVLTSTVSGTRLVADGGYMCLGREKEQAACEVRRTHSLSDDHHHSANILASMKKVTYRLWVRFQAEMMTLGMVAFFVWADNSNGVFEKMPPS